ncbi:Protein of unknown function DUF674 [Dillenia turbinata]|uniref:DUF674 family protein n=1 Tax=Dillenia turbinata TaxID=194707 RepID=A0AAN8VFC7_9MAGN
MAQTLVEIKLIIDTKARKVLFAEAGKDFVDLLCSLLVLPVGTVIGPLSKFVVGSIRTLYNSIENLNETYIQPNFHKDILLKPKSLFSSSGSPLLLTNDEFQPMKYSVCLRCHHRNSDYNQYLCSDCLPWLRQLLSVAPSNSFYSLFSICEGYVKGSVTYMVMDDLTVKPLSTISSISVCNQFNVKDFGVLEEKVVQFGNDEGLKLLREAFSSKNVLTNVFLGKEASGQI